MSKVSLERNQVSASVSKIILTVFTVSDLVYSPASFIRFS